MNLPVKSCPGCRSDKSAFAENYKGYDIYKCQSCGLEYCDPMKAMSAKEYESAEGYDKLRSLGESSQESVLWWGHKQFISDAHKFLPTMPARLLDIGCGTGAFVAFALKNGYNAYGVDFDENSLQVAWKTPQLKEKVFRGDTRDIHKSVGSSQFDIVTFFEVLEHVDDVHFFMDQVRTLLVPNGLIALYVPLADRWSLKYQEREPADYPPNHLTRWTVKALKVLMREMDFNIVKIYEAPVSFGLYRLVSGFADKKSPAANPATAAAPAASDLTPVNKFFDFAVKVKQVFLTPILSAAGLKGDRVLLIAKKR